MANLSPIAKGIAIESAMRWGIDGNLPASREEAENFVENADWNALNHKYGSEASVYAGIKGVVESITKNETDGIYCAVEMTRNIIRGTDNIMENIHGRTVRALNGLKDRNDVESVVMDGLKAIHTNWIKENMDRFESKKEAGKSFQYLPFEYIGWKEVEKDLVFLKPVLDNLGIEFDMDKLKDLYKAEQGKIFEGFDEIETSAKLIHQKEGFENWTEEEIKNANDAYISSDINKYLIEQIQKSCPDIPYVGAILEEEGFGNAIYEEVEAQYDKVYEYVNAMEEIKKDPKASEHLDDTLDLWGSCKGSAKKDYDTAKEAIDNLDKSIANYEAVTKDAVDTAKDFIEKTGIDVEKLDPKGYVLGNPALTALATTDLLKSNAKDLRTSFDTVEASWKELKKSLGKFIKEDLVNYAKDSTSLLNESIVLADKSICEKTANLFKEGVNGLNDLMDKFDESLKIQRRESYKAIAKAVDKITGGLYSHECLRDMEWAKSKSELKNLLSVEFVEARARHICGSPQITGINDYFTPEHYNEQIAFWEEIRNENWKGLEAPVDKLLAEDKLAIAQAGAFIANTRDLITDLKDWAVEGAKREYSDFKADIMDKKQLLNKFAENVKNMPEKVNEWVKEAVETVSKTFEEKIVPVLTNATLIVKADTLKNAERMMSGAEKVAAFGERKFAAMEVAYARKGEKLKNMVHDLGDEGGKAWAFADVKKENITEFSAPDLEEKRKVALGAVMGSKATNIDFAVYNTLNRVYEAERGFHNFKETIRTETRYAIDKAEALAPSIASAAVVLEGRNLIEKNADKLEKTMIKRETLKAIKEDFKTAKETLMGMAKDAKEAVKAVNKAVEAEDPTEGEEMV